MCKYIYCASPYFRPDMFESIITLLETKTINKTTQTYRLTCKSKMAVNFCPQQQI